MCYLEECDEVIEYLEEEADKQTHSREYRTITIIDENDGVDIDDLETFFRCIGSVFITFITSETLNNLLLSKVSRLNVTSILYRNSLLSIFSSEADMIERCKLFNAKYGHCSNIHIECSIWNLCYFNFCKQYMPQYQHKAMMKMLIAYVCINGMHPFIGIDCDRSPNCQWSVRPKCRVRAAFESLLMNQDHYDLNRYDFAYRDAWNMRRKKHQQYPYPSSSSSSTSSHHLLIDVQSMLDFLFAFDSDGLRSFENESFTLFTFENECDYTHKIRFDIVHCDANLNVMDNFKISLFGRKLYFGSYPKQNDALGTNFWNKIKHMLLGHQFVNIQNWYIITIQAMETTLHEVETTNCYYLICAEVAGTYVQHEDGKMYSKLLVWKSRFYSEQQPYGNE